MTGKRLGESRQFIHCQMIPIHGVEAVCLNFTQTRCGALNMNQTYTAIVKQDGPWWIGWIEEVPGVNGQEITRDELLQSLRVTLLEAIEMNRSDARLAAGKNYEELSIAV